jgi:ABC-2 type transport system permease protein
MRNVAALTKRELVAYFLSPMAYIILTVFAVVVGLVFYEVLTRSLRPNITMTQTIGLAGYLLLSVSPMITMRLFADEFDSGTIETLMTAPVTTLEVVLSKYLASLLFLVAFLAPTILFAIVLFIFDDPDPGPILSSYLGVFLLGSLFLAIGMVASACVRTQITAAVLTYMILLGLFFQGLMVPEDAVDAVSKVRRYISFWNHFDDTFLKGIIDTRDVVYFLTSTAFCIFLTTVTVTVRRWR